MGLLKLAEKYQQEKNNPITLTAGELLEGFHHSCNKIDFPYAVFNLFKKLIGFRWGILLIPNKAERRYFVWSCIGHSANEVQDFTLSFDQPEIVAPTEMLIPFVPGHTNEIPHEMIHGGNLVILGDLETPSACIYCQSPAQAINQEELKILNHRIGREINQSRKIIDLETENLSPDKWLDKVKNENVIILVINIEKAAEYLLRAIPGMHLKSAWNEIAGIIRHFKGRIGYLYNTRDSRLILLAPHKRIPDYELYMHQLNKSFSSTLHLPKDDSCLRSHCFQWPEEKQKILEEFPGLFS